MCNWVNKHSAASTHLHLLVLPITALPSFSLLPLHLPVSEKCFDCQHSQQAIAITFRPTRSRGSTPWPVAGSFAKSQQRARSSSIALNELVDLATD